MIFTEIRRPPRYDRCMPRRKRGRRPRASEEMLAVVARETFLVREELAARLDATRKRLERLKESLDRRRGR